MSSHGLQFLFAISWVFKSKKLHFIFLTILLNHFQLLIFLVCLYFSSSLWQSSSHYALECLVMLTIFECLYQILSIQLAKVYMICSRTSLFRMFSILSFLIVLINLLTKLSSPLLFLTIVCFLVWTCSSKIAIFTVSRV